MNLSSIRANKLKIGYGGSQGVEKTENNAKKGVNSITPEAQKLQKD